LPIDLVERYSIKVVPINLIVNGNVYRDGVDISPTEVYRFLEANKSTPTTSSPTPGDFLKIYEQLAGSVDGIVCITICADISMMFNSAIQAKQIMLEKRPDLTINVVDSRTAGGAQGFIALEAAKAVTRGEDLTAVTRRAELMIPRVHMIAVLDTLYYLARSGRIPKIAAWAGSMLKINPILTFAHDGIGMLEKARTKPRGVHRLVEIMEQRTKGKPVHVNIMHANVIQEAEMLKEQVESKFECVELYITDFAPTMGLHAGPGTLALAFYSEEENDVA
jgi:DegV family protein with EDD domain